MKRLLTKILIITSTVLIMNAEEKKDEKRFPGDFGLEFGQEFHMDSTGTKAAVNYGWSDIYLKTRGKAQVAFPIKFYTVIPWVQDAVELPMSLGSASSTVSLNTKNNFYFGLDNTFAIEKIMNIGLNFELKIGSCLGNNPVTGTYDGLEIRLSPIVNLNGSYDFGLSWSISQYFEFYFFPELAPNETENRTGSNMQFTEFEGNYNLAYEFLHFTKLENIKASLYGELYLRARILNDGYYTKDYFPAGHQIQNLDPAVGLTFDIYGFTPSALFFVHAFGNSKDEKLTGSWIGIKAGLGYTKDWFSFNMIYYGMINSHQTSDCMNNVNSKWMNHLETYIKFTVF